MRRSDDGPAEHQWGRFGFLIADLFTLLAMLFLVANTIGHVPPRPPSVKVTPTITPSPLICGLDPKHPLALTLTVAGNSKALRAQTTSAVQSFAAQVKSALAAKFGFKTAGFVIVWAGSYNGNLDVSDGTALANGAIKSLNTLADQRFIFTRDKTSYQPLWDGGLLSNQVRLQIFFYNISQTKFC